MEQLFARVEALILNRIKLQKRFRSNFPLTLEKNTNQDVVFLEKLYSVFDENIDNIELDIKNVARQLFLSRTVIYKKVNALTGCSPNELLKEYRIQKAAELLREGKMTVGEVFSISGFKSRAHFSTTFKDKFKVTPSKYVADAQNKNSLEKI